MKSVYIVTLTRQNNWNMETFEFDDRDASLDFMAKNIAKIEWKEEQR